MDFRQIFLQILSFQRLSYLLKLKIWLIMLQVLPSLFATFILVLEETSVKKILLGQLLRVLCDVIIIDLLFFVLFIKAMGKSDLKLLFTKDFVNWWNFLSKFKLCHKNWFYRNWYNHLLILVKLCKIHSLLWIWRWRVSFTPSILFGVHQKLNCNK